MSEGEDILPGVIPSRASSNMSTSKILSLIILVGMYALFLLNYNLGWSCMFTAILVCSNTFPGASFCMFLYSIELSCLVVQMMVVNLVDPMPLFAAVNWNLLVFLIGIFVVIESIRQTMLPSLCWMILGNFIVDHRAFVSFSSFSGDQSLSFSRVELTSISVLIIILTLFFTSIPTVLLVGSQIPFLKPPLSESAWLILGWCVSLCGNLTNFASVVGVVVTEFARESEPIQYQIFCLSGYFNCIRLWTWMKFGVPSTLFVLSSGVAILYFTVAS